MNMRFSKQELERVNQDSVALPQGGGYLGWYGVFHELHCVVRISPLSITRETRDLILISYFVENAKALFRAGKAVQ